MDFNKLKKLEIDLGLIVKETKINTDPIGKLVVKEKSILVCNCLLISNLWLKNENYQCQIVSKILQYDLKSLTELLITVVLGYSKNKIPNLCLVEFKAFYMKKNACKILEVLDKDAKLRNQIFSTPNSITKENRFIILFLESYESNFENFRFESLNSLIISLIELIDTYTILYKKYRFLHGDLALRNIVAKQTNDERALQIFDRTYYTKISVAFIDFGRSCIQLKFNSRKTKYYHYDKQSLEKDFSNFKYLVVEQALCKNKFRNINTNNCKSFKDLKLKLFKSLTK
jgi:hypothetical protein